jgi:hypothetical protein
MDRPTGDLTPTSVDANAGLQPGERATPRFVAGARDRLRAPWAASVAGLLFAGVFTLALVLVRTQALVTADEDTLAAIFAEGRDLAGVIGGLYLAPFAGILFLWFVAVVRDQIGEREDQFFATVFLGSGLIFVATLFASMAVASAPMVGARYLGQGVPTIDEIDSAGLLLLFAVAFWDWVILVLPAWVALVSVFVLRREHGERQVAA